MSDRSDNPVSSPRYPVMNPDLQLSFFKRLETIRPLYLRLALERTVAGLPDVTLLDAELARFVGPERLKRLARFGLRAGIFYPVPLLLIANPQLIGYYRLLFGLSQKEFYDRVNAPFRPFRPMEERGVIPPGRLGEIPDLCQSLVETAALLVDGLDRLSTGVVHELQLLTVGPQFRGSRNTDLGKAAVGLVFNLIKGLVRQEYVQRLSGSEILLRNSAGRVVRMRFSADTDIAISEVTGQTERNKVAIEVKGGTDVSNRLNRFGEAEKSHLKARQKGFTEFWTISAVGATPEEVRANSPTTTDFFVLQEISEAGSSQRKRFKEQLGMALGIGMEDAE